MSKYSNEEIKSLAAAFKALSNPHRLAIYLRLRECCTPGTECSLEQAAGGCCVGDLGKDLDIALSTLSHHVKELQHAGLMNTRRQGKQIYCSIDPTMSDILAEFIRS